MFLRATATRRFTEDLASKIHSKLTEFKVSPFGLLQLRVSDCSPKIVPLDSDKYPDGDRVVVSHCAGCRVEQHQVDFTPVKGYDAKILSMSCTNGEHAEYCGCSVQVPDKIALDISAIGDADVKLKDLQPSHCNISAEYSRVHLHKIKTQNANIFANNGSVEITGYLTGNLNIKTGVSGFVRADRLQGSTINIDTFEGPISCKAIYADKIQLSSRQGNISASNLQGNVKVWTTDGNVEIGNLEGDMDLSMGRGSLNASVSDTKRLKIYSLEGNVLLGLNDSIRASLKFDSPHHIVTENLDVELSSSKDESQGELSHKSHGKLNAAGSDAPQIEVTAKKGTIKLRGTSWLSSLNLTMKEPQSIA